MKSYAQHGEDAWISANFELPTRGFYLDIGAAHPELNSNTAFLRDLGWRGIAADAVRDYAPLWVGRQPFYRALFSPKRAVYFNQVKDDAASSRIVNKAEGKLRETTSVQTLLNNTIEKALPSIPKIDVVSIDVGGRFELDVFATFNWQRYDPSIIIIPWHTEAFGEDYKLRDYILAAGHYDVANQTDSNLILIASA